MNKAYFAIETLVSPLRWWDYYRSLGWHAANRLCALEPTWSGVTSFSSGLDSDYIKADKLADEFFILASEILNKD